MEEDKEVDMGGTFDFFGEISHPDYQNITEQQKKNRQFLIDSMKRFGFEVINTEWWHFYLKSQPFNNTYFNFDVCKDNLNNNQKGSSSFLKGFIYFIVFVCGVLVGLGIYFFLISKKKEM